MVVLEHLEADGELSQEKERKPDVQVPNQYVQHDKMNYVKELIPQVRAVDLDLTQTGTMEYE